MSLCPRRLLALESATDWISVALFDGDRIAVLREHPGARQHSAALVSVVDATLRESGLGLHEVDAMAISVGPGSFTSLRIGLATLKGLCFGRDIPVVGVSTLETMALAVLEDGPGRGADVEVLALLDARRGDWYAGAWRGADVPGQVPVETLVSGLYSPRHLVEDLPRAVIGVSPEPSGWREVFERAGLRFEACVEGVAARPRADQVGRLALRRFARGEAGSASNLSARYLRRAQAEAQRIGQDVEAGETERSERR